jgi:magnesium transporter
MNNGLLSQETRDFMKDLHEHVAQVVESVEMNREMIWGLMDMHMSLLSNKMNEVMKMLTIISTIFIPLSFIAGLYGMNFEYMPELKFRYAYFLLLALMALIIIGMLLYFKRKKWL